MVIKKKKKCQSNFSVSSVAWAWLFISMFFAATVFLVILSVGIFVLLMLLSFVWDRIWEYISDDGYGGH